MERLSGQKWKAERCKKAANVNHKGMTSSIPSEKPGGGAVSVLFSFCILVDS